MCGKVVQAKDTAVASPDREGQCGYSISYKGNRALNAEQGSSRYHIKSSLLAVLRSSIENDPINELYISPFWIINAMSIVLSLLCALFHSVVPSTPKVSLTSASLLASQKLVLFHLNAPLLLKGNLKVGHFLQTKI